MRPVWQQERGLTSTSSEGVKRIIFLVILIFIFLAPTWAPGFPARSAHLQELTAEPTTAERPAYTPANTPIVENTATAAAPPARLSDTMPVPEVAAPQPSAPSDASGASALSDASASSDASAEQPSPTPELNWVPAGEATVPILLYHHVAEKTPASRYFIPPAAFEEQVRLLKHWGYTSITISQLVEALVEGAFLPARPVVISFDDGYRDVYTHAFPILERYGFVGVTYVIVGQVGVGKTMNVKELQELAGAGWEIGSHSWTHPNLRNAGVNLEREIGEARLALEEMLGLPILTYAYPYGLTTKNITESVIEAGYVGGAGLGISSRHVEKKRYFLSRMEVRSNYDRFAFAALLPWAGKFLDEREIDDIRLPH
jgi:peptidoglycan/xylan/chitin deacetylase (PgdA/CDA1 family)